MSNIAQREIRDESPYYVYGQGNVQGCPKGTSLPKELKYRVPLSFYEIATYRCGSSDHVLCHKCYDKLSNRARFGLCADCFNESSLTTHLVSDAKERTVYLTRRGRKIMLVGGIIRIPIWEGRSIVANKMLMERPYVYADNKNPFTKADLQLHLSNERSLKLNAHAKIPMDYLLAELD